MGTVSFVWRSEHITVTVCALRSLSAVPFWAVFFSSCTYVIPIHSGQELGICNISLHANILENIKMIIYYGSSANTEKRTLFSSCSSWQLIQNPLCFGNLELDWSHLSHSLPRMHLYLPCKIPGVEVVLHGVSWEVQGTLGIMSVVGLSPNPNGHVPPSLKKHHKYWHYLHFRGVGSTS